MLLLVGPQGKKIYRRPGAYFKLFLEDVFLSPVVTHHVGQLWRPTSTAPALPFGTNSPGVGVLLRSTGAHSAGHAATMATYVSRIIRARASTALACRANRTIEKRCAGGEERRCKNAPGVAAPRPPVHARKE